MLNFTVGPIMSGPDIIEIANHSTLYFRTSEFSMTALSAVVVITGSQKALAVRPAISLMPLARRHSSARTGKYGIY